jgi:outer membrane protein assembly factor BamB
MDLARRVVPALVLLVLLVAGGVLAFGGPGALLESTPATTDGPLAVAWVSDTETSIRGNHHAVAAGRVGGEAVVLVPLGGRAGEDHAHPAGGPTHTHAGDGGECALVALDGTGGERWRSAVSEANCTIHAVADPALADFVGDDRPEALATSTDDEATARDPLTGDSLFTASLAEYGYTRPVVADLNGDGIRDLVVVDVRGTTTVIRPDGSRLWERSFDAYTWGQPVVADFTGDGEREVVAGFDTGRVVLLAGATGETVWNRSAGGSVTWLATGDADEDPAIEVFAATTDGRVAAFDGATGEVEWTSRFDALAAVRALGDGDDDGRAEIYATARDGRLRALDAHTGETEWTTTLTTGDVQMTPPPSMGDVDGDGGAELVAPTNDGLVRVVDPADGTVLATYERGTPIYTYVTLADLDGDGASEVYVPYGDGRVVALTYD